MVTASSRLSLTPVLLINFIGALGFSIVLPFLAPLVTQQWQGNALTYGFLAATYPACQFIGAPILGRWSDRYGRRRVLLLSQLGTLLSWVIFAIAFFLPLNVMLNLDLGEWGAIVITLPILVVLGSRALDGITGGNVSVANAYVADVTTDEDRNRSFGRMAVSANLGFIVGPALGGILGASALGGLLPVLAAMGISLIASVLVARGLPESKPCFHEQKEDAGSIGKVLGQEQRDCVEASQTKPLTWGSLFQERAILFMLALNFLMFLGFNFFYTAFPVHAIGALQWKVWQVGAYFSVLSALMVLVQGPVLSRLSKRFSEGSLIVVGCLILGTNFLLLTSRHVAILYLAASLFALGNGLMWPSFLSLLSKVAGKERQGSVQGMAGSVGSLASIVGLILGGLLYGRMHELTFVVSAVLIYLSGLLAIRLLRASPEAHLAVQGEASLS